MSYKAQIYNFQDSRGQNTGGIEKLPEISKDFSNNLYAGNPMWMSKMLTNYQFGMFKYFRIWTPAYLIIILGNMLVNLDISNWKFDIYIKSIDYRLYYTIVYRLGGILRGPPAPPPPHPKFKNKRCLATTKKKSFGRDIQLLRYGRFAKSGPDHRCLFFKFDAGRGDG